jgi:tyramine---L-glutamate ligase
MRMSYAPTVLVYEFITAGGWPAGDPAPGLAAEALGMLWALLADFRSWGAVRTIAPLDPRFEDRIPGLNRNTLPADEVVEPPPGNYLTNYIELLKHCNAALVIAPETSKILPQLTACAEASGVPLLGSNAAAIANAGNKAGCHRLFSRAGLPNPETRTSSFKSAPMKAKQMGCPLVIKPIDGIGSEGVCLVNSFADLSESLALVGQATSRRQILMQSFVRGIHVSVSLLALNGRCVPLSLNRQLIEAGRPFRYDGSQVPFIHEDGSCAIQLACSAVKLFPGLKGYAGVDLVLGDGGPQLIEINPRLTTSYIGLRQVSQLNLAKAIWDSCINEQLPESVPLDGQVFIKKNDPGTWGLLEKIPQAKADSCR